MWRFWIALAVVGLAALGSAQTLEQCRQQGTNPATGRLLSCTSSGTTDWTDPVVSPNTPAVVQSVGAVSGAGASTVTTGAITVTAGNSLVVLCGGSSATISALLATDSLSDTFTSAKSQTGTVGAATVNFAV